ncbi:hypothetical protein MNBD_GAMMA18-1793 [hydrothermal vent metagenome]|uniref:EF-hand domain-containing protein n=1 Tax=hydrothermal vent metagenome TaxID=652676 RepID=A0A3B0ZJF3_9ZZZZ
MSKKLIVAAVIAMFAGAATAAGDVFATLDTNINGAISKDEAYAMPSLTEQWGTLDVDGNGELSAEEFAAYVAEEKPAAE